MQGREQGGGLGEGYGLPMLRRARVSLICPGCAKNTFDSAPGGIEYPGSASVLYTVLGDNVSAQGVFEMSELSTANQSVEWSASHSYWKQPYVCQLSW